jgi:ketohexokinase
MPHDLQELTYEEFVSFAETREDQLAHYTVIHFEGRNIRETGQMMDYVLRLKAEGKVSATISVEIENARANEIECLITGADLVFLSKTFVRARGYGDNMFVGVREVARRHVDRVGVVIVCAWAEEGACAGITTISGGNDGGSGVRVDVVFTRVSAYPPATVVDTLGAGDTFVAGVLYSVSCNGGHVQPRDLQAALEFGCRLAGLKCGQRGLLNLPIENLDYFTFSG